MSSAFDYSTIRNARHLLYTLRLQGALPSEKPTYPGELAGIGIIGKVFLQLLINRGTRSSPTLWERLDRYLQNELGRETLNLFINRFLADYPPLNPDPVASIHKKPSNPSIHISIILLLLAEANPGMAPYQILFISRPLLSDPMYHALKSGVERFFDREPSQISPGNANLLSFLMRPFQNHPTSIYEQLQYIRDHWQGFLPHHSLQTLQRGLDYLREDQQGKVPASSASLHPEYFRHARSNQYPDQVRFSQDQDWMSSAVLIAKNSYVWLDQLSRKYSRLISTLDQIPLQELANLSNWGINALWLIGIWERSPASKTIKQLCGNPDAIPSAYSIFDYSIAQDLGGEKAFQRLQETASQVGIRLAADMVPNHMGVTSQWVLDHPERFLSLGNKPFPGYSYTGPDLSPRDEISIRIEDHYYDRSDAAVVFERVDHRTGNTRYIYHGNDGTAMPWNDTAQLNYLREDVREAVLDTILHIADKFSIIRFDAAMTLAKKHYQRLWFPPPGKGGAIPTRSDHSLTEEEFEAAFPEEFWRRVVDHISSKKPDTLLIAEAFWMMEGYFVRNLGMHRVYNSAFMHMLRDEQNAKFRELIKNVIAHDPGILKRFVNYMNNPDEETAVAQFGKSGKYFGVCTMMVTLPGLPMFGHGQIEGFQEKYGMEYSKALIPEKADQALIQRHQREIFPLLAKRDLFSGVEHFELYDFITPSGAVDDNVFAFSNGDPSTSALVVYHNKWGETEGHLHSNDAHPGGILVDALGLKNETGTFVRFKDISTGKEFLRPTKAVHDHGFPLSLDAYQYHVFHDFQMVHDTSNMEYKKTYQEIGNRGVVNLDFQVSKQKYKDASRILVELLEQAVVGPTGELITPSGLEFFANLPSIQDIDPLLKNLYREIINSNLSNSPTGDSLVDDLVSTALNRLSALRNQLPQMVPDVFSGQKLSSHVYIALSFWALHASLLHKISAAELRTFLHIFIDSAFSSLIDQETDTQKLKLSFEILLDEDSPWKLTVNTSSSMLERWLANHHLRRYLGINTYQGIEYFHRESYEDWLCLWYSINLLELFSTPGRDVENSVQKLDRHYKILSEAGELSHFQLSTLFQKAKNLES